ncbi:30S ribosomal protein S8e [Ignicoccus hospitalis]|uniref:Small ribosomal subunit protein eS8 n=1 Tax=Ignicoccus hospitalis (strain KIN4/I / DSM 18386 / JCM 14125) TaxID=453591 RepID=RS8E_IGNH4|nr:30S ribosomal protein S8e [Ignicoccus hospitalis]A8AAJ7.1 RecName: Full=Small ribosomal subunit protein eS8; AltName: Full=30S ribosomal protein S8e [Ignicoccus hospitalis KIN4/I]ABU81949.1 SSU ribosomal protein S8E [Ignicoccus hospitalis KIN4/I]HIH89892.1 30S ribosomal protein S8e [Desulfurococcaceae archaeon]
MGVYHGPDLKKITGGKKRRHRKVKRKYWMGRYPTNTTLAENEKRKIERVRGGNIKVRLRYAAYANVVDPNENVAKKVKILRVLETPANKELARHGIIVKGTKIETELGVAVVTSRPGQDGVINAVLIERK